MAASKLRYTYLAFFSKPRADRRLFRLAKRLRATQIVELGIGSIDRTLDLIGVCQRYSPGATIRYTGLDWFEERPSDAAPLSLIDAHRRIKSAGAEARLMPGGPAQALPAVANSLLGTSLLMISAAADDASLAPGWFYVPRMLVESSVVLRQESGAAAEWSEVSRSEIDAKIALTASRAAA